jgi:anti-anti-sigma factor
MNLSLSKRTVGSVVVLDLRGRVTFGDETNFLRNAVKEVLSTNPSAVVLNLSQVAYVDSGGIGTLVGLYTSAHSLGCELKLASPNDRVKHVLQITKLYPILGVYSSEERALAELPRRASA